MICFGSNGFNYPIGSWDDGYSAATLLGAMQDADNGQCNIWNIGNGWDLAYDTFGQSPFTAVVCGGRHTYYGGDYLHRRIQCEDDQVLVMWYERSGYSDYDYDLIQGTWVKQPKELDFEIVSGVTVADPIIANVIIAPENSVCTIEFSKATCHPPGWSTPGPTTAPPTTAPPTTAPPTTAPPASGGGDDGTTNTGGGGTSTGGDSSSGGGTINEGDSNVFGGDTIHNNIVKEEDEEKGCGPECMGAIASVASAGVAFLGLFVGRKYWKKNSDSNEDQEEEGSSAGQSRLNRIVPFGGHTNKKVKDPPPEQHPEATPMAVGVLLTDEEVETDEEEEKPKKKKKKKKKKSTIAVDGAVPDSLAAQAGDSAQPHEEALDGAVPQADDSEEHLEEAVNEDSALASEPKDAPTPEGLALPSTSPSKKKKKKKKSVHKAHGPSEELASEEMDELSAPPLDGTSPTKKKKKKKRLSTEEGSSTTKKRSSSKVVTIIEDPIDPETPKDTGAGRDGSDGNNGSEVD